MNQNIDGQAAQRKYQQFLQYSNSQGDCPESQTNEWLTIYHKIKNENSYKFMYSDIDGYVTKVNNLIANELNHPKMLVKKSDHQSLLNQLKLNFLKLVDHVNMLDLSSLGICMQYVFDKLLDCLQTYFSNLLTCIQILNEQTNLNQSRYVFQSKCTECQGNILQNKIESMMTQMTMVDNHLNIKQMDKINKQINELSSSYEDVELTLMIDEILLRKQSILNCKNPRIQNIYDQIAQYLENIPQSTINLNREHSSFPSTMVKTPSLSELNIGNFTQCHAEFGSNFIQLLKIPIKKLIKRVFQYAKSLYNKKKDTQTTSTQTLLIKDEQNIKMLLKNNEVLKKQLELLKKIKRESEKDMVKLLDSEQKNGIKIVQLTTQNSFWQERYEKISTQLNTIKKKLQISESHKKEMGEKLVKDHTSEKVIYLKTIKQLQLKIETTGHELMRLRKQTQSAMVSESVETTQCMTSQAEAQTEDKCFENDNLEGEIRFSSNNPSRKTFLNKMSFIRKSDNNEIQSIESCGQKNMQIFIRNNNDFVNQNKSKVKIQQKIKSPNAFIQTKEGLTPDQPKSYQHFTNKFIIKNEVVQDTKQKKDKKRQSIIQKINKQKQINYLVPSNDLFMRGQRKKLTQTLTNINQKSPVKNQDIFSQIDLRLFEKCYKNQNFIKKGSRQGNRQLYSGQDEIKNVSRNNIKSHTRIIQSSRMFTKKQNLSPYIGSQSSSTFVNLNKNSEGWLQLLEVNNKKNLHELKMEIQKEKEKTQKIKFISRIMQKYKSLKETGLLKRINEIVSMNQLEDEDFISDQQESPQIQITQGTMKKTIRIENENNKKAMQPKNQESNKISRGKIQTFSQNQLMLLFVSIQNAQKYQQVQDIWKNLNHSIMLDYNFMNFCDQVEIFFVDLYKQYAQFYSECSQFLSTPCTYMSGKNKLLRAKREKMPINQAQKRIIKTKTHHKQISLQISKIQKIRAKNNQTPVYPTQSLNQQRVNNLNPTIANDLVQKEEVKDPHQLRNIIHQLLRYHKIVHKKCSHVEQFLYLIGLNNAG